MSDTIQLIDDFRRELDEFLASVTLERTSKLELVKDNQRLTNELQTLQQLYGNLLRKTYDGRISMIVDIKERRTRRRLATFSMKPFLDVSQEDAKRIIVKYWTNQSLEGYELVSMQLCLGGEPLPKHALVREIREVWVDPLPFVSCTKGTSKPC